MPRVRLLLPIVFSISVLLSACQEDPEAAANKLFVEASSALNQSKELEVTGKEALQEKSRLLALAVANLDRIVEDYPSSSLAVDLAASGAAKGISVSDVKAEAESTDQALFCLDNAEDGACALQKLMIDEATFSEDSPRRSSFAAVLAANGRFDEALILAMNAKARRDVEFAAMSMAVFGIMLGDEKGEKLSKTAIPTDGVAEAEVFIQEFKQMMKDQGWKRSTELAERFTQPAPADSVAVEGAFAGMADALRAGDMEKVRLQMISAFLVARTVADASGDASAFANFQNAFFDELTTAFN